MDNMEISGQSNRPYCQEKAGMLKPNGKATQIPAMQQILVDCAINIEC